jgi:hypothetical protein
MLGGLLLLASLALAACLPRTWDRKDKGGPITPQLAGWRRTCSALPYTSAYDSCPTAHLHMGRLVSAATCHGSASVLLLVFCGLGHGRGRALGLLQLRPRLRQLHLRHPPIHDTSAPVSPQFGAVLCCAVLCLP